jgi:DNA (cytosine-5)-methyltransferase 1
MKLASFFAGIGGFDLGFENAGIPTVFHCEIDPYCQRVLKRHWPHTPLHDDITTLKPQSIPKADIWSAGWPCQDLSHANNERTGLKGSRSALFYRFADLAGQAKPRWIVLENVSGLLSAEKGEALESVTNELEKIGYLGGWFTVNTLDAGLPHNRERVFIIGSYRSEAAYQFLSNCREHYRDSSAGAESKSITRPSVSGRFIGNTPLLVQRRGGFGYTKAKSICPTIRAQTGGHQGGHSDRPILCGQKLDLGRVRETNGVPRGLDGRRGRFIGNAVAPPIAFWIAKNILLVEKQKAAA